MMRLLNGYRLYKLSRKLYLKRLILFAKIVRNLNQLIHNSHIPYTADLGEGSRFAFGGIGMVIAYDLKAGKNVVYGQGITIGGRTGHGKFPTIGDNVFIAAGSRLIGGINIGSNVVIGVNSVVIDDVPDNCIVAGIPARIISRDITKFKNDGVI